MEWDEMRWNGVERDEMRWNRMRGNGSDGIKRNGMR